MQQIEERLIRLVDEAYNKRRGARRLSYENLFKRLAYVYPDQVKLPAYKRRPVAVFNPGAVVKNRDLLVFPRLVFDYYTYVSSIGYFKLGVDDLLSGVVPDAIDAEIVVWPRELWEFLGSEDPRVHAGDSSYHILYTGKGYRLDGGAHVRTDFLGYLRLDSKGLSVERKQYITIGLEGETYIPVSNKDSTLLSLEGEKWPILTRPKVRERMVCWSGVLEASSMVIDASTMKPILVNEDWEVKVGWSTNAIRLSSNEYLVGWHCVLRENLSYLNGLAIVSDDGELLAVSDYLLYPTGLTEEYGDRPLVIFGNGLVSYKEYLIWVGGVSDYAIGFFASETSRVLDRLRWLRRG